MNNLKYFRKKNNVTQGEIAKYLGLTTTAYGHYETGRRQISPDNLAKLADFYHVTIDDLMGRGTFSDVGKQIEEVPEITPEDEIMIPLVASLRCGPGSAGDPFTLNRSVPVPASYVRRWGDSLKAVIAVGESMIPTIVPGDMLICKPGDVWENGNIVSVNFDDTDMIKRIYQTADGIDLCSDNPKFETIHVTDADMVEGRFHILGRVMISISREL